VAGVDEEGRVDVVAREDRPDGRLAAAVVELDRHDRLGRARGRRERERSENRDEQDA
jgi:hypothetical protein